jgi:hypothetical protein
MTMYLVPFEVNLSVTVEVLVEGVCMEIDVGTMM